MSVITYAQIKVTTYELKSISDIRIEQKINEHTKLYLSGIIPEEYADSYVTMTHRDKEITVIQFNENSKKTELFNGIVTNVAVKTVRDVYYIEIEAFSHTYKMDTRFRNRSFQDGSETYTSILHKIVSEYSGDAIDTASHDKATGSFLLQYNETDWLFLKRLASHFNVGLIPCISSNKLQIWFGLPSTPEAIKIEECNYSVSKNIMDYMILSENYISVMDDHDFVCYDVETEELIALGSEVNFREKKLYVLQATTIMINGVLTHRYILSPIRGLSQPTIYNYAISGLSLLGRVLQVEDYYVKLHLEVDEKQNPDTAWWFNYSTVYSAKGNTGWYCMPEIDDYVRIYFPDFKEKNAISISAERCETKPGDKIDDPNIKYFRTKSGKELKFSPEEILITCKDEEIFIRLNEKVGIEIISKKKINIISEEDVAIESGSKIILSAEKEISMNCKQSSLKMDGSIEINGSQIKIN